MRRAPESITGFATTPLENAFGAESDTQIRGFECTVDPHAQSQSRSRKRVRVGVERDSDSEPEAAPHARHLGRQRAIGRAYDQRPIDSRARRATTGSARKERKERCEAGAGNHI